MHRKGQRYAFFIACISSVILCSCVITGRSLEARYSAADTLAKTASFERVDIPAPPFLLTSYHKVTRRGAAAILYIEGDGLAWVSRTRISLNPTPKHPTTLQLAALDTAPNIIYLARPCQYTGRLDHRPCDSKYWTSHRSAPDVIESYMTALNTMKAQSDIPSFHLVGYSGGAAIAALLATRRDDILSLRTIAGNLDHRALHLHHDVSLTPSSLNPIDEAHKLQDLRQIHYVGSQDKTVIPAFSQRFIQAQNSPTAARQVIIEGASHETGWAGMWRSRHKDF